MRVISKCLYCGKEFDLTQSDLNRGRGRFCGQECFHLSRIGTPLLKRRRRTILICQVCGVEYEAGGKTQKDPATSQFCSRKCVNRGRHRKGVECKALSPTEAAYLAGLIDGEGSVMLIARTGRQEGSAVRVSIANTSRELLEWVKGKTGIGLIYLQREQSATHKASYSWRCHGDGADTLLRQIRPYLLLKGRQADLAMESHKRLKTPSMKVDMTWQIEYRNRMKTLNRRGPVEPSSVT